MIRTSLGNTAISSVSPEETPRGMLLNKIKERIRLDLLAEEEKAKNPERTHNKMSRAELIADGWAILSLASAKEIMSRPLDPMLKVIQEYNRDADSGMSFSDYLQLRAN
jgi:sugar-specific transcriptional regulator TrmB